MLFLMPPSSCACYCRKVNKKVSRSGSLESLPFLVATNHQLNWKSSFFSTQSITELKLLVTIGKRLFLRLKLSFCLVWWGASCRWKFVSECLSENELQSKKHQQEERNIKTKAASRRISATLVKLVEFSVPLSLPTLLSILLVRREVRLCKWSHQCKRIQQALMSGTLAANKWAESSPHRLSSLLVMLQLNCAANKQESRWGFARKTL